MVVYLDRAQWRARAVTHRQRLASLIEPWRQHRARGKAQPVMDFLFEYYRLRPSTLLRWSPGHGVVLDDVDPTVLQSPKCFVRHSEGGFWLDPKHFARRRRDGLNWIIQLLENTAERPAQFGCFGLHEWAMLHRCQQARHPHVPLRVSPGQIAALLERHTPLPCTHFDAFRFFTPASRPLNRLQLEHGDMLNYEQSGCLHANMDLYRWTIKLQPWLSAEHMGTAFELARRIREVDMRASPYDLRAYGLEPIEIETEAGRHRYQQYQRVFQSEATALRQALIAACRALREDLDAH